MIAEIAVDLGALRRNVARLSALIAPAAYAAVVKANAYGHGLTEVARALEASVASFCVYRMDEAEALRAAGIERPILVLGPVEPHELGLACRLHASITLWSRGSFAREAARVARTQGVRLGVHGKIDTGVTRLGLEPAEAAAALTAYLDEPSLDLRGVFTHLAAAEELESAFTLEQLERFDDATRPLRARFAERGVVRHAAASAAAMLFPRARLDLVRAGIATYGIWPSEETRAATRGRVELEPSLSWTTELVVVRAVEAGRSVGYGCTFRTERPSRIGVLPIGYAEGVPRSLSSAGVALVGGRRVPFVGRVCMNMSFVDVTGVPDAHAGSRVTLIGRDRSESIDANECAAAGGSIGYEVVARLPREVPRRYTESGPVASAARAFASSREK